MIVMEGSHRLTVEQMSSFLTARSDLAMEARTAEAAGKLVPELLSRQRYSKLPKAAKGTVRQYLMRITGYGRAQIAKLSTGENFKCNRVYIVRTRFL